MAANHHHHQCHCHPTPPTPTPTTSTYYYHPTPPIPTTTTCHCTTTHYPPQTHLHPPPQPYNYHVPPQNQNNHHAPPQTQQKYQPYHQHENTEQNPPPLNPTVSSLIHRITALETTLRRRNNQSTRSSSLRDTAARTIQTHFRSFLVHRSVTLRHLQDLAYVKSALNNLKSSVSNNTHFDSNFISRESTNLLIKLESIQGSDPMIRDGKRLISRELIRFMNLIDQISVKNIRISKIRASGSRVLGTNERKLAENLKKRINKIRVSSKTEENEEENLEIESPRKHKVSIIRNKGLTKSHPKGKKNVSFDENGNVYRFIKMNPNLVLSDRSDSSGGDDEDIEETELVEVQEEDENSSEMSENEMDPRKNLSTRSNRTPQKNKPVQESDNDEEEEEEEKEDGFVFSAPMPARMEYRVDSVNKKQTGIH